MGPELTPLYVGSSTNFRGSRVKMVKAKTGKDFHFCEADTLTGKPYCQDHCDVAYIDERELKKEKEAQKNRRIAA